MTKAKFESFVFKDENYLTSFFPENLISIFDYTDSFARELLFRYKFECKKYLSRYFADVLKLYLRNDEIIVPIPSSAASLKQRGWDQMDLITKNLENKCSKLLLNNSFAQQKTLNKADRIIQSESKFSLNKKIPISKQSKIVLIDDVYTTGNTIKSAYKILNENGFKNIRAITLYAEI